MNVSVVLIYTLIFGTLLFIFWHILTSPINLLHIAIIDNDLESVRNCLDRGVDVDVRQGGVTPLCVACYQGSLAIAELLISRGAKIDEGLRDEGGVNPLLNAAMQGHNELVKLLLDCGARTGFHFAALSGDIETVKKCINEEVSIHSTRNRGMTPLHFAALGNQIDVAALLLESGADINIYTTEGETPLRQAIRGNSCDTIDFLARHGADLNRIGLVGTPLHLAIFEDRRRVVELLIDNGADVNAGNETINFPLHMASRTGKVEIAELLIQNGAKVNASPSRSSRTPLHWAACNGHLDVAKVLVRYGADVNSKTLPFGETPLSDARGNQAMTDFLLAHGATDYGWVTV